jgi:hypothetical protein
LSLCFIKLSNSRISPPSTFHPSLPFSLLPSPFSLHSTFRLLRVILLPLILSPLYSPFSLYLRVLLLLLLSPSSFVIFSSAVWFVVSFPLLSFGFSLLGSSSSVLPPRLGSSSSVLPPRLGSSSSVLPPRFGSYSSVLPPRFGSVHTRRSVLLPRFILLPPRFGSS